MYFDKEGGKIGGTEESGQHRCGGQAREASGGSGPYTKACWVVLVNQGAERGDGRVL